MTTHKIETDKSGNALFINNIPVQSDSPKDGEAAVYSEKDNQWKFVPVGEEYMQVINTSNRNFNFNTTDPVVIKYDNIITSFISRNIEFDIQSSSWTLQPGAYQLSVYFPSILISIPNNVPPTGSIFQIYWKNKTDDIKLENTGFNWIYIPPLLDNQQIVHSSTISTVVELTKPTTFQLEFIAPQIIADFSVILGFFDSGYSSVLIKTLK